MCDDAPNDVGDREGGLLGAKAPDSLLTGAFFKNSFHQASLFLIKRFELIVDPAGMGCGYVAQFRIVDSHAICALKDNKIIAISVEGNYYLADLDPKNGGECKKILQRNLLAEEDA